MPLLTRMTEHSTYKPGFWWRWEDIPDYDYKHIAFGFNYKWGRPWYCDFDMERKEHCKGFRCALRLVKARGKWSFLPEIIFWKRGQLVWGTDFWPWRLPRASKTS